MILRKERGQVLVQQTGLPVAHKLCASFTRISMHTKFRPHWCSGVGQHACSHLRASMGAVKDHKANTSLTALWLCGNNVGDAGVTALAKSLQATVLTCELYLFQGMCFLLPQMSRCTVVLAVGVVQFVCAASVFFLLSRREAFTRAKIFQSWCGRVPESLGPKESLAIGTCSIAVRHHISSSGLWRTFRITAVM